jgi:hypothetical protein
MNFLTRGAVLASGLFISLVITNPASAAFVQYTFSGGSGSTGTLILDGAVSANSGWGPLSGTSLVNYFEFNGNAYVPPNTVTAADGLASNTGANLDSGNITFSESGIPPIPWALAFSPNAGSDQVIIGSGPSSTTYMGNWSGGTAVPIPAALWLFGSGLLAFFGVARRKQQLN